MRGRSPHSQRPMHCQWRPQNSPPSHHQSMKSTFRPCVWERDSMKFQPSIVHTWQLREQGCFWGDDLTNFLRCHAIPVTRYPNGPNLELHTKSISKATADPFSKTNLWYIIFFRKCHQFLVICNKDVRLSKPRDNRCMTSWLLSTSDQSIRGYKINFCTTSFIVVQWQLFLLFFF